MKSRTTRWMLTLAILLSPIPGILGQSLPQTMHIMTFNLRYDQPKDGEDAWNKRREDVMAWLNNQRPDILGTQEGLEGQMKDIKKQFKDYTYIGVGRDNGRTKGEYCGIWYRPKDFECLESGHFWVSATPERPSKGWDASLPRICQYAKLKDRHSEMSFWVYNTHLDHKGVQARKEGVDLILNHILTRKDGLPWIWMGDFNFSPKNEPYSSIPPHAQDAALVAEFREGPEATTNQFIPMDTSKNRIDYVWISSPGVVYRYRCHTDTRPNGRVLSDHYPVSAWMQWVGLR